jgi:hypothetical protein
MKRSWILSLSLGTLAGCATLAGPLGQTGEGPVILRLQPTVQDGGLRTQALVDKPWTRGDIDHVVIVLKRVEGGGESDVVVAGNPVKLDIASGNLSRPISFRGLHRNTTYMVRASAYRAPGEAAENLISAGDGSKARIEVTNDDMPPLAALPIKLQDIRFSGKATTSFNIIDGKLLPTGKEAAAFEKIPPLGNWVTMPETMPESLNTTFGSVLQTKGKAYLIGSITSTGQGTTSIAVAPVDDNGALGNFTISETKLISSLFYAKPIKIGDFVYVLSGLTASAIQRAAINTDGSLGTFSTAGTSPGRPFCSFFNAGNYIYTAGGDTAGLMRAKINQDGTVATFASYNEAGTDFDPGQAPIITRNGDQFYILGSKARAKFTTNANGDLTTFEKSSLPSMTYYGTNAALLDGYLVFLNSRMASENFTPVTLVSRGTDGQLLDEHTSSFTGPTFLGWNVVQTRSYLYALGSSTIQRARIN